MPDVKEAIAAMRAQARWCRERGIKSGADNWEARAAAVEALLPVDDPDNPEWTAEDFARARPAHEALPPEVLAAFPNTKAPERICIGVTLEGGLVQSIWSDRPLPNVRVVVIDYDTDDADPEDLTEVRQRGPKGEERDDWSEARVTVHTPEIDPGRNLAADFRDCDGDVFDPVAADEAYEREAAFLRPGGDAVIAVATLEQLVAAFSDQRRAEAEGWGIFESDTYGWEIEANGDENPCFVRDSCSYDDEAVAWVRQRAAAGSLYHQMALAIHEKQAEARKAACIAAGYRVSGDGGAAPFVWTRLDAVAGAFVGGELPTEEAAWAAAYRDLGERGDD